MTTTMSTTTVGNIFYKIENKNENKKKNENKNKNVTRTRTRRCVPESGLRVKI